MKKIIITIFSLVLSVGFFSPIVFAQSYGEEVYFGNTTQSDGTVTTREPDGTVVSQPKPTTPYPFKIQNPLRKEISSIPALIYELINFAMTAGVYLAVLALIWVGFTFVLAQGNDSKISEAKKALWYVIIGIAILLGSKLIVEVIKNTLSQFNPLLFK